MEKMTEKAVLATLETIETESHNFEIAHMTEKLLWERVLLYVANGGKNGRRLARLALKSKKIRFGRWYT